MAWNDRSYYRDSPQMRIGGGFSRYSVVSWLIGINAVIFLLDSILQGASRIPEGWSFYAIGFFSVDLSVTGWQQWRWITYQFLHGDFIHILFNMIVLYFFGPMMEQWWGRARFIAFYLLCGVAGAVLFTLFMYAGVLGLAPQSRLIGASAAVLGVLIGCAVIAPDQRVMLIIPPIPLKLRTLAWFVLGLAVLSVVVGSRNAGGEVAHLGGMALGFLLIKKPRLISWFDPLKFRVWRNTGSWERKQRKLAEEDAQINRILAKVKEQGLHSLTRREKKLLQKETDRLRSTG